MKRCVLGIVLMSGISGCFNYASTESSTPVSRCLEYGYEEGTKGFKDCLAEEARNDRLITQQRSDARRSRIQRMQANSAYCQFSPYC